MKGVFMPSCSLREERCSFCNALPWFVLGLPLMCGSSAEKSRKQHAESKDTKDPGLEQGFDCVGHTVTVRNLLLPTACKDPGDQNLQGRKFLQ